ncbi:hypothetical protein [Paenibacillus chitinolyticus]|uniref:hypothetical protein n=1 Tax=Paenibacillus chitinolyticus TaxID=79263 RepID=UPI00364894B4
MKIIKKITVSAIAAALLLTGVVSASASSINHSAENKLSLFTTSETMTEVRVYETYFYPNYSDIPDKVWYSNGSNKAGWLYKTDAYQNNGHWYITYKGTIYIYD